MRTNVIVLLVLVFWPPSFASAENGGRILVDCAWVAGYVHGVAVLRDQGTSESALIERVEALVKAKRWPDRLKVHLTTRIHLMFADLAGAAPYSLSADYLYNCTVAGGNIPENGADGAGAVSDARVARTIQ
jgi:hypothetical protein